MFSSIDILSFIRLPLNNFDPLFFFFLQFKLCILQQLGFYQLFNVIILWSWFVCRIKVQIHIFWDKYLEAMPLWYLSRRKHCSQESLSKSNSLSSPKRICLLIWNISWLIRFLFGLRWTSVSTEEALSISKLQLKSNMGNMSYSGLSSPVAIWTSFQYSIYGSFTPIPTKVSSTNCIFISVTIQPLPSTCCILPATWRKSCWDI